MSGGFGRNCSPAECIGTRAIPIIGQPNPKHISTSYVERAESHDENAHAPLYPLDQRFLKEGRESRLGSGALFHALHVSIW